MDSYIFLFLPNTYDGMENWCTAAADLLKCVKLISTINEVFVCFDPSSLGHFSDGVSSLCDGESNFHSSLRIFMGRKAKDISQISCPDGKAIQNFFWDIKSQSLREEGTLPIFCKAFCQGRERPVILFDPCNILDQPRDRVYYFSDFIKDDSPSEWSSIMYFSQFDKIENWLKRNDKFSLENPFKFCPTNRKYKGARIYFEFATRNHWYEDTNHKSNGRPHYEVFNETGDVFIGTADYETGNISLPKQSERNRKLNLK